MTNSKLQKGHIYIQLSNHYTATVRNIEDFKYLLNDENEEKSIVEIVSVYNVTKEFETEVREIVAEFHNKNNEPEQVTEQAPEIKVDKRTAKKINRLFLAYDKAMSDIYDLKVEMSDEDTELWRYREAKKELAKAEKNEEKFLDELCEYFEQKEITDEETFCAHLNDKAQETFDNMCLNFESLFV